MVPGWSERERHALNSSRSEWIRLAQRNGHVRKTRSGTGIVVSMRAFLDSVARTARRWLIAHSVAASEVIASGVGPGSWQVAKNQTMNGGTK